MQPCCRPIPIAVTKQTYDEDAQAWKTGGMAMRVRMLTVADLAAIVMLEAVAWPADTRASQQKLSDRLRAFGKGFFGCLLGDKVVGMASSQVIRFDPAGRLRSWSELTTGGWISKTHDPSGNCLHFVSICVHPDCRGQGIGTRLNEARLGLARELGLSFALTDTRLPGLGAFLKVHADKRPEDYLAAVRRGEVIEPVVRMYLKLGFEPLGIIPNCMESDRESADYGLAMLKRLKGDGEG
jgi:GNAT superfamily N-acetyltransferase